MVRGLLQVSLGCTYNYDGRTVIYPGATTTSPRILERHVNARNVTMESCMEECPSLLFTIAGLGCAYSSLLVRVLWATSMGLTFYLCGLADYVVNRVRRGD